jgi:acetyltransferase-like isoleucine patch superfamily enzyme
LEGAKGLTLGHFCRFEMDGRIKTLTIGNNCEMGDLTHIVALNKVLIGNNVLIASKCFISDTSHGQYKGDNQDNPCSIPNNRPLVSSYVRIGNNVWIGENAVILPGADIGDGCIIGANSVISKLIPKMCIVVDNNRVIKKWDDKTNKWIKYDEN